MPGSQELPDTLKRSSKRARHRWVKVHDNAVEEYGEGRRAHQTAWAALEHDFQKKGDRWVARSSSRRRKS